MKIIVCTGDSHTWGQGADGAEECFNPALAAGDSRAMPFHVPCYVNVLRRLVGTDERELTAVELARTAPGEMVGDCFRMSGELRLDVRAAMVRVHFRRLRGESRAEVLLDGEPAGAAELHRDGDADGYGFDGIKRLTLHCADGEHELRIRAAAGEVLIYRIELYSGATAVVNSGVGSCPTRRYMDEFWGECVSDCRPDIVLAEAHTINDWLTRCPPEEYEANVREYLGKIRLAGAVPILMTVAPVAGAQSEPHSGYEYESLVEASRRAAAEENVALCDAGREIAEAVAGLSESEKLAAMYHDAWHVNNTGHRIYAQCAAGAVRSALTEVENGRICASQQL